MRLIKTLSLFLLFLSACKSKEEQPPKPDIAFDKTKWNVKAKDGDYAYRKQMVKNILSGYKWEGVKKDSLVQMLGQPDVIEEGAFVYYYELKPGLIGTAIEAITFEISADSTICKARYSDDGFD
jgi:hypothetical protein